MGAFYLELHSILLGEGISKENIACKNKDFNMFNSTEACFNWLKM